MNQDPPVLIPYVEKDIYSDINTNSHENTFNQEQSCNGYLTNGNKSPPMPTLYEADRDPPPLFNIQDIFSALTKDEYDDRGYSKSEHRNESDSLFEKMYKDYSTTLNTSTDQICSETVDVQTDIKNDTEVITKSDEQVISITKDTTKKPKRRRIKRVVEYVSEDEDLRKYGIKSLSKRGKEIRPSTNLDGYVATSAREQGDNKYLRSPYIAPRHRTPKKHTSSTSVISSAYEIVNPALRGSTDHHTSVYRPNVKAFLNNQFSQTSSCVCALCGHPSSFLQLGAIYGPYFIDRDSVHTLPLTSIFPSEANEIGVSGKSAIKSDKNGNVKMVIQSTRGRSSRKSAAEDYRVTWDGEVWLHRECVLWAPGTFLRGDGKIGGLDEALKMALNAECCVCHKIGAILNCTTKSCEKNFHYYCAMTQDSKLNNEQLSVLCNKHKER